MKQKSKIETFNLKFFLIKLHFKTKQLSYCADLTSFRGHKVTYS